MTTILQSISTAFYAVIGWLGTMVNALFGTPVANAVAGSAESVSGSLSNLAPLLFIGAGIGVLGIAFRYIKSSIWGC